MPYWKGWAHLIHTNPSFGLKMTKNFRELFVWHSPNKEVKCHKIAFCCLFCLWCKYFYCLYLWHIILMQVWQFVSSCSTLNACCIYRPFEVNPLQCFCYFYPCKISWMAISFSPSVSNFFCSVNLKFCGLSCSGSISMAKSCFWDVQNVARSCHFHCFPIQ